VQLAPLCGFPSINNALTAKFDNPGMYEIRAPRLKRLLEDWESRRNGREFPGRADFTPADLKYILGNLSLIDVAYDPLRFSYRLHASILSQQIGKEMTKKSVDEMPSAGHAQLAREHFTEVVQKRVPIAHRRDHVFIDVDAPHDCEALVLPLSSDGTVIDMLMSALVWDD
jgi:hypothetical protein